MSSKYIVRLAQSATEDDLKNAVDSFEKQGGKVTHQHTLFKGFSGELPTDKATALESIPHVEAVEKDQGVSIQ